MSGASDRGSGEDRGRRRSRYPRGPAPDRREIRCESVQQELQPSSQRMGILCSGTSAPRDTSVDAPLV